MLINLHLLHVQVNIVGTHHLHLQVVLTKFTALSPCVVEVSGAYSSCLT